MKERYPAQEPLASELVAAFNQLAVGRYTLISVFAIIYFDWIILLDQEVKYIYSSRWNLVKVAFLFTRYYPLVVAPFQFWGFILDHDESVCESHYRALFASIIPTILSGQFILALRTYVFTGRKKWVLSILSISFLGMAVVTIWGLGTRLSLSIMFLLTDRSACLAISNQPSLSEIKAAGPNSPVNITAYDQGTVHLLMAVFDALNMSLVVWHCIRERGTLGPLGLTFVKQGILVYLVTTVLSSMSIATYFSGTLLREGKGSGPWFAYMLPSTLSCRLLLTLRRQASPTETKIRGECSNMVNEALEIELRTMNPHPASDEAEDSEDVIPPPASTKAHAQA